MIAAGPATPGRTFITARGAHNTTSINEWGLNVIYAGTMPPRRSGSRQWQNIWPSSSK